MKVRRQVVVGPVRPTRLYVAVVFNVLLVVALLLVPIRTGAQDRSAGPAVGVVEAAPVPALPEVPGWVVSLGGPLGVALFMAYKVGQGLKVRVTVDLSEEDRLLLRTVTSKAAENVALGAHHVVLARPRETTTLP